MNRPAGRIHHLHILHPYVPAAGKEYIIGPPGSSFDLLVDPPVGVLSIAVDGAGSDDVKILRINGSYQRREHIKGIALPGSQVELTLLVCGHGHARQHRVVIPVGISQDPCALIQEQCHVALEEKSCR